MPRASSAGKVIRVPNPTTVLISPAATPADRIKAMPSPPNAVMPPGFPSRVPRGPRRDECRSASSARRSRIRPASKFLDVSDSASPADLDRIAAAVFGIRLRDPQRRALTPLMAGRDTLAVLPTGSGKTAIYQVGGLALGGLTVVVSPLIALQRDQLRAMTAHSEVRAVMLNSAQHHADRAAALGELAGGRVDFVMLGPEQLANAETMAALAGSVRP